MSNSDDSTQADWYLATQMGHLSVQTSSFSPSADSNTMNDSRPDPESNEYSNRQSAKINAGLDLRGSTKSDFTEKGAADSIATNSNLTGNAPAVDLDFSTLYFPACASPTVARTIESIVCTLLCPPPHAFLHDVLSIQWVIGAIGQAHFEFCASDERYVLRPDSKVRKQGKHWGLPDVYLEWLCGDEEGASPTEQGMMLTQKYFDEVMDRNGGRCK